MQAKTLRPGLLISLKTTVGGENIKYKRRDIEEQHLTAEGMQVERWEMEKTITDPAEYETGQKVRNKARSLVVGVCVKSAFGLLCPENSIDKLDAAIAEARRLADDFNATAELTYVNVYMLAGRIVPDDVEAVRAIASEMRELIEAMADGVRNLDAKAVREAADKARDVGRMLSPEAQARIQETIDVARGAARRIKKAGEQAAAEIDRGTIDRIAAARTAFLDLDEPTTEIAAPEAEARAVDFEPVPEIKPTPAPRPALEYE